MQSTIWSLLSTFLDWYDMTATPDEWDQLLENSWVYWHKDQTTTAPDSHMVSLDSIVWNNGSSQRTIFFITPVYGWSRQNPRARRIEDDRGDTRRLFPGIDGIVNKTFLDLPLRARVRFNGTSDAEILKLFLRSTASMPAFLDGKIEAFPIKLFHAHKTQSA